MGKQRRHIPTSHSQAISLAHTNLRASSPTPGANKEARELCRSDHNPQVLQMEQNSLLKYGKLFVLRWLLGSTAERWYCDNVDDADFEMTP